MKVSSIYGKPKATPRPEPLKDDPKDWSYMGDGALCRRGTNIYLNHTYGPRWACTRCGFQVDLKKLIK